MRFVLSTACLLVALASTADARPARNRLQEKDFSLGISGALSGSIWGGKYAQPAEASKSIASTKSAAPAKSTPVKSKPKSSASTLHSSAVSSKISTSKAASSKAQPSKASPAAAKPSSSSVKPSKPSALPTASPSKASSASKIPVSSPNLSSVSKSAHSQISAKASSTSKSSVKASSTSKSSAKASASKSVSASSTKSSAKPLPTNGCASAPDDAPYTLSCGEMESVITFPNGFRNRPGGIVFLVHGTGSTGEETWGPGPYNTILPNKGPGYDIAWFTSPTRALGDAQVTAEYIAYNIKRLAAMSATKKVFIIGHSQGNINIQWALAFWPSVRKYVTGFSSLAGDFHGTAEGPLLCTGQNILQGGCEPSVFQQSVGSKYLSAQNIAGGSALVPTTSIYTIFDDIIQPEIINPTSELPGALNLRIQDLDLCGPGYIVDHFLMTVAAGPFYLTLSALENNGVADRRAFGLNQCVYLTADSTIPNPFETVPGVIKQIALDAISVVAYAPKVPVEPLLMPYVCAKGASGYC